MNRLPLKPILLFTIYCLLFTVLFGCATIKEIAKCVAGVSTKVLEEGRKDAIKKNFSIDRNTCYDKVLERLKQMGTYIYAKDAKKQMVALYIYEAGKDEMQPLQTDTPVVDTTPVGIFFKELDTKNTQIEVSSPSTYAKEFIATKIFSVLEKANEEK